MGISYLRGIFVGFSHRVTPKMGNYQRDPQKALPYVEPRILVHMCQNPLRVAVVGHL